jgi:hypothetical protein
MTQEFLVNFVGVVAVMVIALVILTKGFIWVVKMKPKEVE